MLLEHLVIGQPGRAIHTDRMGLLLQDPSCLWPSAGRKVMLGAVSC